MVHLARACPCRLLTMRICKIAWLGPYRAAADGFVAFNTSRQMCLGIFEWIAASRAMLHATRCRQGMNGVYSDEQVGLMSLTGQPFGGCDIVGGRHRRAVT